MDDLIELLEDLKEYMEPKIDVETEFRDIDTVTTTNKEGKFYSEIEDALKRLKRYNNPLLHAAKNILIEWDSRMPEGKKEERRTIFNTIPFWCPSAMLVSSQYIAALREEVEKLEK